MSNGIIVPPDVTYPRAAEIYVREISKKDERRFTQTHYSSLQPTHGFSDGEDSQVHEYLIDHVRLGDLMRAYSKALNVQKKHNSKDRRKG